MSWLIDYTQQLPDDVTYDTIAALESHKIMEAAAVGNLAEVEARLKRQWLHGIRLGYRLCQEELTPEEVEQVVAKPGRPLIKPDVDYMEIVRRIVKYMDEHDCPQKVATAKILDELGMDKSTMSRRKIAWQDEHGQLAPTVKQYLAARNN